ncbi:hypothetical protein PSTG_11661 [Puccinia striiformis f. sp. tritici PST-78]|uniref:DDE Tnp4 domain-containing protein n=1 Tax=Puccinia striiformis f. sp. tritici PST-78 TaxID=1165861 RepID=A0A0L0V6S6_9BASI|nr:hypothetical protein PSTG_11661 [Puccinia striiformis f. sp. tritici PST-78]
MPRVTRRKKLLHELNINIQRLIVAFRLQQDERLSPPSSTTPWLTLFFITLHLSNQLPGVKTAHALRSLPLMFLLISSTKSLMATTELNDQESQNLLLGALQLLLGISSQRYFSPRLPRTRIATRDRSFEVIFNGDSTTFLRWACIINRTTPKLQSNTNDWLHSQTLGLLGMEAQLQSSRKSSISLIEKDFVVWPTAEEHINLKRRAHPDDPFRDCVGYVNGTIIELAAAPLIHKEDYWMRKLLYGFNSLLVCDVDKRIIDGVRGWCGSAHDQRVYQSANLYLNPDYFFSPGEYLLADSGYTASNTIVPAFKQSPYQPLPMDKHDFNYQLSSRRVAIEQCIGMLKM